MQPVRIQRSRQHKQISPNGLPIKYVGRGSKHGNPFKVELLYNKSWCITTTYGMQCEVLMVNICKPFYDNKEAAVIDAIKCYQEWRKGDEASIKELVNSNLSCWCKLSEKCHGDILLELANN